MSWGVLGFTRRSLVTLVKQLLMIHVVFSLGLIRFFGQPLGSLMRPCYMTLFSVLWHLLDVYMGLFRVLLSYVITVLNVLP